MEAKEQIGEFPLEDKLQEAEDALKSGALELDPVMPVNKISLHKREELITELNGYFNLVRKYELKHPSANFSIKPIWSCETLTDFELFQSIEIMC